MSKMKNALAEINEGGRADGNALMMRNMLEHYLTVAGQNVDKATKMLNYGCWCQLLGDSRRNGMGDPVDKLDEICKKYQACTRCVAVDNVDFLTGPQKLECTWESARYEIDFDSGSDQFTCLESATDQCGMAQCSERALNFYLKFILV